MSAEVAFVIVTVVTLIMVFMILMIYPRGRCGGCGNIMWEWTIRYWEENYLPPNHDEDECIECEKQAYYNGVPMGMACELTRSHTVHTNCGYDRASLATNRFGTRHHW